MKLDKRQKTTFIIGIIIIAAAFIIWLLHGGEIWTKTEVLVQKSDPLFDSTYKEWQDKFIWGLDITLAITGVVVVASTIMFFIFKKKRNTNETVQ